MVYLYLFLTINNIFSLKFYNNILNLDTQKACLLNDLKNHFETDQIFIYLFGVNVQYPTLSQSSFIFSHASFSVIDSIAVG